MTEYCFKVGDRVLFTNCFGVCWGVKIITALDERSGRPTYHYAPTDTPWFSTDEEHLTLADHDDLVMDIWGFEQKWSYFQDKYSFIPTEYYGCY